MVLYYYSHSDSLSRGYRYSSWYLNLICRLMKGLSSLLALALLFKWMHNCPGAQAKDIPKGKTNPP